MFAAFGILETKSWQQLDEPTTTSLECIIMNFEIGPLCIQHGCHHQDDQTRMMVPNGGEPLINTSPSCSTHTKPSSSGMDSCGSHHISHRLLSNHNKSLVSSASSSWIHQAFRAKLPTVHKIKLLPILYIFLLFVLIGTLIEPLNLSIFVTAQGHDNRLSVKDSTDHRGVLYENKTNTGRRRVRRVKKNKMENSLSLVYNQVEPPHNTFIYLVSTLNGKVHGVDQHGHNTLWTNDKIGGPLIKTSKFYSDIQVIPSINGNLYVYKQGEGIQKLPMTVNELVNRSPFHGSDGTVYISSKHSDAYLLDMSTGEPVVEENRNDQSSNVFTLVRVNYNVVSMDAHDHSLVKWNFTYSEVYPLYQQDYEDSLGALSTVDNHLYLFRRSNDKRLGTTAFDKAISLEFDSQPMSVFRQLNIAHRIPAFTKDSEDEQQKFRDEFIFRKIPMPIQELSAPLLSAQYEQIIHIKHNKLLDSLYALELPKNLPVVVFRKDMKKIHNLNEDHIALLPSTTNTAQEPPRTTTLNHIQNNQVIQIDNQVWDTNDLLIEANRTNLTADDAVENYTILVENHDDDIHPNIVQKDDQYFYIFNDEENDPEFNQNWHDKFTVTVISISLIVVLSLTTIAIVMFIKNREERRKRRKDMYRSEEADKTEGENGAKSSEGTAENGQSNTPAVSSSNSSEYTIGNITLYYSEILGYGSNGTIVYNGVLKYKINESFIVRKIAVKRMLKDFVKFAQKEISLLIESDSHSNIVRYYAQEEDEQFIYLALELCNGGTMEQYLQQHPDLSYSERQRILKQLVMAIEHIHQLGIVHRDLKPANILLDEEGNVKLSDMGLGKRLEQYQSSFYELSTIINTRNSGSSSEGNDENGKSKNAAIVGTIGWQAPEILLHIEQTLQQIENGDHAIQTNEKNEKSQTTSTTPSTSTNATTLQNRMTKAVDIFALGCIIFFVLTGKHPYGRRSEREWNILHNKPVSLLEEITNQSKNQRKKKKNFHRIDTSVMKLIYEDLIVPDPTKRISASQLLKQSIFWDYGMKLHFLSDVSDQLGKEPENIVYKVLQENADKIFNGNPTWDTQIDDAVYQQIKTVRKYDYTRVWDVLRCIRNLKSHYREYNLQTTKLVRCGCEKLPDAIFVYFDLEFPHLFPVVYELVREHWSDKPQYKKYFN